MIASVTGRVASLAPDAAIVEVGGVGLLVHCTPGTLAGLRTGESATLATVLVVREDSLTLFGFATADERVVFELLQTATGVGPRLAQAVLAVHAPDAVRRAVATEDLTALTQVPGIGRKGAQRIVLELKDRLGPIGTGAVSSSYGGTSSARGYVREALVGLGYPGREADEAVAGLPGDLDEGDLGGALKLALRSLDRRG
ncbi:MAG TPA: Holliday junction branch migration protein RuvA [Mycobacteriales bacterium]|nr:Holliday junction branch migration protein RuvA [Mycobacteriales bacterium]